MIGGREVRSACVALAAHVVMVLGEVNPANGVASFVRGFAAAVPLAYDGLFTPAPRFGTAVLRTRRGARSARSPTATPSLARSSGDASIHSGQRLRFRWVRQLAR